jgi:hypothetical protein
MFETLADRMKRDEDLETSRTELVGRWLVAGVLSVLVFTALWFVILIAG